MIIMAAVEQITKTAVSWSEQGLVPNAVIRGGIRRLLQQRLVEIRANDCEAAADSQAAFVADMRNAVVAPLPDRANEQHYEVPAAFFRRVLGPNLKYSCCYWPAGVESLADAEEAALRLTCQRAGIENGMDVLDLGCGWGSLSLWMARRYPDSRITAVSNSHSQKSFITKTAAVAGVRNLQVIVADMNEFGIDRRFDRIVSVEMFEHMRNHRVLFDRIHGWLKPDGRFFMHIFCHRSVPYEFVEKGPGDWMSRHFFSGGIMPCDDLPLFFQDALRIEQRWRWDGCHYRRTSEAWLQRMDSAREELFPLIAEIYGADNASMWWMRWRIFFMACSELFGYNGGNEWWVSHYLFRKG